MRYASDGDGTAMFGRAGRGNIEKPKSAAPHRYASRRAVEFCMVNSAVCVFVNDFFF